MTESKGSGSNQPAKKSNKRRRRGGGGGNSGSGGQKAKRPDLWRPVPQLADPVPITPSEDPTALIRSLGDPPLQGQGAVAEHYLAAVAERAATLATALAASAGLLALPDTDPED